MVKKKNSQTSNQKRKKKKTLLRFITTRATLRGHFVFKSPRRDGGTTAPNLDVPDASRRLEPVRRQQSNNLNYTLHKAEPRPFLPPSHSRADPENDAITVAVMCRSRADFTQANPILQSDNGFRSRWANFREVAAVT